LDGHTPIAALSTMSRRDAASVDSPAYGIGVIVRRLFRLHSSMVCHDSIGGSFREPSAIFDSGQILETVRMMNL
jgi:hypothetical protein